MRPKTRRKKQRKRQNQTTEKNLWPSTLVNFFRFGYEVFLSIEFSCGLGWGLICFLFRAFKTQNDWEGYRDSVRECRCHQRQSGFLPPPVPIDFSSMARLLTVVGTSADTFFPFLIEFFCWIGLDLICFCFGFLKHRMIERDTEIVFVNVAATSVNPASYHRQ